MHRRSRQGQKPRVTEALEVRWLLAAAQIPGNIGQVVSSQFQPFGFPTMVGTQLSNVQLRGTIESNVSNSAPQAGQSPGSLLPPINSGLIKKSQFNGGGFETVGVQLDHVKLRGGLSVSGFDNENVNPPSPVTADPPGASAAAASGTTAPALINRGLIDGSQFNDRGFGTVTRDPKTLKLRVTEGRIGLQWRDTRVRGPVNVGLGVNIVPAGATATAPVASSVAPAFSSVAPAVSSAAVANSNPGQTIVDLTTNTGQIKNSQFNDGGFGDIGMQWSDVAVSGHVGTSSNTLFVTPRQDKYPPITVQNQVYGQPPAGASAQARASARARIATRASAPASSPPAPAAPTATQPTDEPLLFLTTYTNSATNSGRLIGAQFNDGGFGDIGLQWRKVGVGGNVTAVHNSLTVQPVNKGQGFITVQGTQFPTAPPAPAPPPPGRLHKLPTTPPAVPIDGDSVTGLLPTPTGPLSPFFPTPFGGTGTVTIPFPGNLPLVNSATNSGLVKGGQFNAGGFGDEGLQWLKVHVGGNVQLVHNSLSVHPEGSMLAGISVSNVAYGPPVSRSVARHLKVLHFAVISGDESSSSSSSTTGTQRVRPHEVIAPPNDRILTNQQLAKSSGSDVFIQWNGIEHKRGLVVVHNIIMISGVGPATGPITLSNIRFPYRVPNLAPLVTTVPPTGTATSAGTSTGTSTSWARTQPRSDEPVLLNAANNSGILNHAQFSTGGFGDVGLQWRRVSVSGSVAVVHNTLAVDESSDLPPGDVPGPITINNVTFNSQALGGVSRPHDQVLVSPPDVFQVASTHIVDRGKPLRHNPAVINQASNTGFLIGGQLGGGAANHVLLQWQCTRVRGRVTVMDNVLSISMQDRPTGPITISNVTFA
jgi:hypothetical protein